MIFNKNRDIPTTHTVVHAGTLCNTRRKCCDDSTMIAAVAAVFAFGVLLWIAPLISGNLKWNGDVVNRAVVLGYDKSYEIRLFMLSCFLVPGISGLLVFFHRLQGRIAYRVSFIEALIHFPLVLWPLSALFAPEYLGVLLLIPLLIYSGSRILLLWRFRLQDNFTISKTSNAMALDDSSAYAGGLRDVIIASLLLGAVGISFSVASWIPPVLSAKTVMIISLVSGIIILALIWWIIYLLISLTDLSSYSSILGMIMISPAAMMVFINIHPYDSGWKTGILVVCGLFVIGTWIALVRWRGTGPSTRDQPIRWISRFLWWVVTPAILYASVYIHDITGPIDLYHEGERITPAEAMKEGATPYRDVFLWHGLFENGIKARIGFGIEDSVSGVRRIEHLLEPLELVALYALLSVCLQSPLYGLIGAVIAGYTLPSPHGRYWLTYLAYASLTAWLVRGRRNPYLAGLGAGFAVLALFYSLDGGLAALVAIAAGFGYGAFVLSRTENDVPRLKRRTFQATLLGICAGAALPVGYLAYHGSIGPWVQSAWDIAGGLSDRSSIPYPSLISGFSKAFKNGLTDPLESKTFALYLPPFVILWGLSHLLIRRIIGSEKGSSVTLPVVIIGAALFFRAVIRRPDADHLGKILPLLVVVIAVLIRHHINRLWIRGCTWPHYMSHGILLGGTVLTGIWISSLDSETAPALIVRSRSPHHEETTLKEPLRLIQLERAGSGVVAHPARAAWIEKLVEFLSNRLDVKETFYDFTNRGLLYYLADRPCPTRYVQTTYAGSHRAQQEVIDALESQKPTFVIFPSANPHRYAYDKLNHPFRHPLITRYLYRNYMPWTMVGDAIILTQKGDAQHKDQRRALAFIRTSRFHVDVGHIPRLLGELSAESQTIRSWDSYEIYDSWQTAGRIEYGDSGVSMLRITPKGKGKITSPRLSLKPDPNHTVVLTMRSEHDGNARLMFSSSRHNMLDGSAALTFRIKGGSDLKEYRIDVGLLPAWMWRGRISRIRIEFDAETSIVDISSIEIRTYLSNSETLYIN